MIYDGKKWLDQKNLANEYVSFAPDSSAIRSIINVSGASAIHATLPPHTISKAVQHTSIEEIWYIISGRGEMWRKSSDFESIVYLQPGVSLTIPRHTSFQFRSISDEPLCFFCCTIPAWPGDREALFVQGPW